MVNAELETHTCIESVFSRSYSNFSWKLKEKKREKEKEKERIKERKKKTNSLM